jgi:hypothetical protein
MGQIEVISIIGTSPYQVYVCDVYGNHLTLLGTISNSTPPSQYFYPPPIFDYAPLIVVKIIDSNNCQKDKKIQCSPGCGFAIYVGETELIVPSPSPTTTYTATPTPTPSVTLTTTPTQTPINTNTPSTTNTNTPTPTITHS